MNKVTILIALLLVLILSSFYYVNARAVQAKKLRHVVAFKFKPEVSLQQQQKVTQDFYDLQQKIPQILAFEGGADVHFQAKKGQFTHCFIVTVQNEKDLSIYGDHPDHKAFSKTADPLLAEVMVVDYWSE